MKIFLIGMARPASTSDLALVVKGRTDEPILVNRTHEVAVGEAFDLGITSARIHAH